MFFNKINVLAEKQKANSKWKILFKDHIFTVKPIELHEDPVFYTIGSCFAEYVKKALEIKTNKKSYPFYDEVIFNKNTQLVDTLNYDNFHMNFYSSSSIIQEFKRSFSNNQEFFPIPIEGIIIENGTKVKKNNSIIYQDPYRREVYANTREECIELSNKINKIAKEGLLKSNTFIITLGLIEIFYCKKTQKIYNQHPGYQGIGYSSKNLEFKRLTYEDVKEDLHEIVTFLKSINNKNKIIFSVSPIPLGMTFSEEDIYTANLYSKSTLRSAVQTVIDNENGVYYFPAYELAMNLGSYFFQERDLRHAKKEYVSQIMDVFLGAIKIKT